ncbi:hypothetical protein [Streptomyces sp. NPDC091027]|uniref:hypothetical protein n=1 Tax=Streptomyces sp. NPDC091027 TaxID=3365971 RepID=UPI003813EC9B
MSDQHIGMYLALAYVLAGICVALAVVRPISRAMGMNHDTSDTGEYIICGVCVLIAAALWPMSLLMWWSLPNRPEGKNR